MLHSTAMKSENENEKWYPSSTLSIFPLGSELTYNIF